MSPFKIGNSSLKFKLFNKVHLWPFPGPDKQKTWLNKPVKIAKLFDLEGVSIEDQFFKIMFLQDHCWCLEIWAHSLLDHKNITFGKSRFISDQKYINLFFKWNKKESGL